MRSRRILALYESSRAGLATIDLARVLAETSDAEICLVAVAPRAASGSRCGNSATEYNKIVAETVARDLADARARLGPVAGRTTVKLLSEGHEPSLEQFVRSGGFDLVLLPARRRVFRAAHHPEASRLSRVVGVEIRVVEAASQPRSPRRAVAAEAS